MTLHGRRGLQEHRIVEGCKADFVEDRGQAHGAHASMCDSLRYDDGSSSAYPYKKIVCNDRLCQSLHLICGDAI